MPEKMVIYMNVDREAKNEALLMSCLVPADFVRKNLVHSGSCRDVQCPYGSTISCWGVGILSSDELT